MMKNAIGREKSVAQRATEILNFHTNSLPTGRGRLGLQMRREGTTLTPQHPFFFIELRRVLRVR